MRIQVAALKRGVMTAVFYGPDGAEYIRFDISGDPAVFAEQLEMAAYETRSRWVEDDPDIEPLDAG